MRPETKLAANKALLPIRTSPAAGSARNSRFYTLRAAVEKSHANGTFQFRDRPGNGGLAGVQKRRCLVHAAGLHDGHQDVQIMQLHPTSDTIAQLHRAALSGIELSVSIKSIIRAYPHPLLWRSRFANKPRQPDRAPREPEAR